MAIPFKHNIDLEKNQLLNAVLHSGSAPGSPEEGQVYYNTTDKRAYVYCGATKTWVGMDAADAVMTGADIISAINDLESGTINLARVDVDVFDKDSKGLVPKGVETSTGKFLRDDGGWETPAYASAPGDVGLSEVTNNKQVKALGTSSTTDGYVPTWDGANGDKLKAGYEVVSNLSDELGATAKLATAQGVKTYIGTTVSAADAMRYKGAIDASVGGGASFPSSPKKGDTWKISAGGTIGGVAVEAGDMIIALNDKAGATTAADWNVIQANIDGAVTGPVSATSGNFAAFGASPTLIADSGKKAADFAAAGHDHYALHPKVFAANLGASASQDVKHDLGTRDVICKIYRNGDTYQEVMADIYHKDLNNVTVKFATEPAANAYRIVIMGLYVAP